MKDYDYSRRSIGDWILNGLVAVYLLILWPFKKLFKFIQWFVLAVIKEVGATMVKYVAFIVSAGLIAFIGHYFLK